MSKQHKLKVKKYNFKERESEIFQKWQDEQLYNFNPDNISDQNALFTIDTPPPYTNASWHMGGAIHYSQIDMIARIMRMKGKTVNFPMGLDRNGLPIEIAAEKEFKVNMHEIPRQEFLDLCQNILDKFGGQILDLAYKLGLSCNSFIWDKVYKTDHPQYRALTQATFIDMWNKGLIYEDARPNNWDPKLQTTVADAEIEYVEGQHELYEIQFTVKETGKKMSFATTRPELIPAIRLIVYHPDDKRYSDLENKTAQIPLWDIEVKIRPHPMADPEFGTGIVQICSYGDIQDVRVLREFQIDPVYAINIDGKLTSNTGKYAGMTVKEGRKAIVKDLKEIGAIIETKTIPYRFPISERSKAPIEFIGMPEYYLKQEKFVETLRQYAEKLQFHPPHMRQIWLDWLDRISMDWPISRRRFYGTEVPVWHCKSCGHSMVPEPGKYYQPWKEDPPFEKCEKCGASDFEGDTRTFDTWMDSSISALYVTKYPNNDGKQSLMDIVSKRNYIADIRPQGKDIVRTWLHYSMLRLHLLYNKPAFNHAWISGHVVTESGEKMSKSKGNAVKPEPIVAKYGGDALRLFGAMEASNGSDIRFSEDRLKGGAKFLNKLYNIARFISSFEVDDNAKIITESDKWILAELNEVMKSANKGYDEFDFHPAARALRNFTVELFSSHYMELIKNRAYNRDKTFSDDESNSARKTLHIVLDVLLKYLAPITPFITDFIYRQLHDEQSVHMQKFPEYFEYKLPSDNIGTLLTSFNSAIWKLKKDNEKSLRDDIKAIELPPELQIFEKDLKYMHNIKSWEPQSNNTISLNDDIVIKYDL